MPIRANSIVGMTSILGHMCIGQNILRQITLGIGLAQYAEMELVVTLQEEEHARIMAAWVCGYNNNGRFNSRDYDKFERMELMESSVRDAIHELKTIPWKH